MKLPKKTIYKDMVAICNELLASWGCIVDEHGNVEYPDTDMAQDVEDVVAVRNGICNNYNVPRGTKLTFKETV